MTLYVKTNHHAILAAAITGFCQADVTDDFNKIREAALANFDKAKQEALRLLQNGSTDRLTARVRNALTAS